MEKHIKQRKIVISTKSLMLIWTLFVLISFSLAKQYSSEIACFYFLGDIFSGMQICNRHSFQEIFFGVGGILSHITKASFS